MDGLNDDRVFDTPLFLPVTVKLRGLTIQNGAPPGLNEDGGGINVREGSLILENMVFRDNQASDNGGGAYVFRGDAMIVRDSVFERNSTLRRGGGFASNVRTTVERTRVTDNTARLGGGIHVLGCAFVPHGLHRRGEHRRGRRRRRAYLPRARHVSELHREW